MGIRIKNFTHWNTAQLRAFVSRAAKQEGVKNALVIVKYNRAVDRGYVSGHAQCPGYRATICVPSQNIDRVNLASVIAHELGHLAGVTHPQMRGDSRYRPVGNWRERYAWGETLPLERVIPEKKERPSIDDKLAHAHAKAIEWAAKAKRVQTMLKKWTRKVRYYEKQQTVFASRKKK